MRKTDITTQQRERLRELIRELHEVRGESFETIAAGLTGVSDSTIYNMYNAKWNLISDKMILKTARGLGIRIDGNDNTDDDTSEWLVAPTEQYNRLSQYLATAQSESIVLTVVGHAGCGKTTAIDTYRAISNNVCVVSCASFWTKKIFLREILKSAKIKHTGGDIYDLEQTLTEGLLKQRSPLLVFDEIDKLSDSVLYFYITLYNKLRGKCGIVSCSTPYLIKRLERGVRLSKLGYEEIRSRMGMIRYLPAINDEDIEAVCRVNGVTDNKMIRTIVDTSEGDLRFAQPKIVSAQKMERSNA